MKTQSETWRGTTESLLDYLNTKIPEVPEVTREEIAFHFSAQMAIAFYDAYEDWNRDFYRATKTRRPSDK